MISSEAQEWYELYLINLGGMFNSIQGYIRIQFVIQSIFFNHQYTK